LKWELQPARANNEFAYLKCKSRIPAKAAFPLQAINDLHLSRTVSTRNTNKARDANFYNIACANLLGGTTKITRLASVYSNKFGNTYATGVHLIYTRLSSNLTPVKDRQNIINTLHCNMITSGLHTRVARIY